MLIHCDHLSTAYEYLTIYGGGGSKRMWLSEVEVYTYSTLIEADISNKGDITDIYGSVTTQEPETPAPSVAPPPLLPAPAWLRMPAPGQTMRPMVSGEVATAVNARYDAGGPSDVLAEAGVFAHVFDGYEDAAQPWLFCHER